MYLVVHDFGDWVFTVVTVGGVTLGNGAVETLLFGEVLVAGVVLVAGEVLVAGVV